MDILNWASIGLSVLLALSTAGHALLNKRTPPSALGWVAVCLMFPFVGPLLYFLFGINRVQTRARKLEDKRPFSPPGLKGYEEASQVVSIPAEALNLPRTFSQIAKISDKVTRLPLLAGNRIEPLHNGEAAYPTMLEAIRSARQRVFLTTYIFDTSRTGNRFIDELAAAAGRGVEVRVIIDGFGELYSLPRAGTRLKQKGVKFVRFMPPKLIPPAVHMNLRNHRKILIVDGRIGFTGGMNISDHHMAKSGKKHFRVVDMHFCLSGPIVMQLEQTFLEDWAFCSGDPIEPVPALPETSGEAICRAIIDGPNEDIHKLSTILIGAISSARERILIMTPYFLPSTEMISALRTAALSGIEVSIVLPAKNNLPFIQWATNNLLWDLLYWGVRVYFQPPPFVHTKLLVVDDLYAQIGSANIDPRSLRMNFELSVEVYDRQLAQTLSQHIRERIAASRRITIEDIENRPFIIKIRDALTWLFSPYL